ncbi:MAG TPA: molybdopterin molybdotransferase MoeA [Woeseiaceae bacterium]|nr:molybdopterin molybdotransferase MoeA [Woeseiaceae bacterium]
MLTTAEAIDAIAAAVRPLATEMVPLANAAGRILRQHIIAERDQPPFDRVTMDGIAVSFDAIASGTRRFRIETRHHAGDAPVALAGASGCIEVMTGAVLPRGADCVIPVERIAVANDEAAVEEDYSPERHQFVHPRGSDYENASELLAPGSRIMPVDVAIIASAGLAEVEVARRPVIRVVSTGNELVPPGLPIEAHQVRLSNGPALLAMLAQQGFTDCEHDLLADDRASLRARIGEHLDRADVLILSGGVSMGKADFVPAVLAELGVTAVFHKISQRPGKPMWFGTGPRGQAVFALPGNPVSTLVCCRHYVLPALLQASGRPPRSPEYAVLAEEVTFRPELTWFLPVRLESSTDGELRARPVPTNTSGDFASLGGTDGYVELARERSRFPQGTAVPLHRWAAP